MTWWVDRFMATAFAVSAIEVSDIRRESSANRSDYRVATTIRPSRQHVEQAQSHSCAMWQRPYRHYASGMPQYVGGKGDINIVKLSSKAILVDLGKWQIAGTLRGQMHDFSAIPRDPRKTLLLVVYPFKSLSSVLLLTSDSEF
jgi:hypothetical protein